MASALLVSSQHAPLPVPGSEATSTAASPRGATLQWWPPCPPQARCQNRRFRPALQRPAHPARRRGPPHRQAGRSTHEAVSGDGHIEVEATWGDLPAVDHRRPPPRPKVGPSPLTRSCRFTPGAFRWNRDGGMRSSESWLRSNGMGLGRRCAAGSVVGYEGAAGAASGPQIGRHAHPGRVGSDLLLPPS